MLIFPRGKPEEDLYIGKSIDHIISMLGAPISDNNRVIDENYVGFESEPDYSMFFTLAELREKVTIRVLTWEKGNDVIIVWGKRILDDWIIFSSLNRKKNTYF